MIINLMCFAMETRSVSELQKNVQKLNQTIQEQASQLEDEQRLYAEIRETAAAAERRCGSLAGEVEEARVSLEQADRARMSLENELHEAAERLGELSASNANLAAQKRKLESDLNGVQMDLDEAVAELRVYEEKLRKSANDAARLAEELRQEQVSAWVL